MPWCPKCGTEYREGFDTCADCGEMLLENYVEIAHQYKDHTWLSKLKLLFLRVLQIAITAAISSFFAYIAFNFIMEFDPYRMLLDLSGYWVPVDALELCDTIMLPCATAGFVTGIIMGRALKLRDLLIGYSLSLMVLVYLEIASQLSTDGRVACSWQEIVDLLLVILLVLFISGLASFRGRKYAYSHSGRQLLWFIGFLLFLIFIPFLMMLVFNLLLP